MTAGDRVVELRAPRRWRILVGLAVPAFAVLMVLGSAEIMSGAIRSRDGDVLDIDVWIRILIVVVIVAVLGGLIVVPGTALLVRTARGVPDVRFDETGVVWGRDRSRDLSIDWADIEAVTARTHETEHLTDRVFVLRPRPGRSGTRAKTLYGRVMGAGNRIMYGSPFTISTIVADHSWDAILQVLAAHLPNARGPFDPS
jgi:hypothetical protein